MGSPTTEAGRSSDEGPLRRVTIRPLAVGKFEVTFAEWDACIAAGGCNGYRPSDRGWGRGRRPVIEVNWDDAQAYVQWLSHHTEQHYRLLSEAEWEYAARGGTATAYSTGTTIAPSQAWFGSQGFPQPTYSTIEVGSFEPNAFDLNDMSGNAFEWVQDCYGSYSGLPANEQAYEGGNCTERVLRGGAWYGSNSDFRSARRFARGRQYRGNFFYVGFRVARSL